MILKKKIMLKFGGVMLALALSLPQAAFADSANQFVERKVLKEDRSKNYTISVNYKKNISATGETDTPEVDFVVNTPPADGAVSNFSFLGKNLCYRNNRIEWF